MTAKPHSRKWWALVVLHNCMIHPLLPIADYCDTRSSKRAKRIAALLFKAHDATFPEGAG